MIFFTVSFFTVCPLSTIRQSCAETLTNFRECLQVRRVNSKKGQKNQEQFSSNSIVNAQHLLSCTPTHDFKDGHKEPTALLSQKNTQHALASRIFRTCPGWDCTSFTGTCRISLPSLGDTPRLDDDLNRCIAVSSSNSVHPWIYTRKYACVDFVRGNLFSRPPKHIPLYLDRWKPSKIWAQ